MYYDIDTYLYSDGSRPYDAASGRYFTSSSLASGVNFVYSFAGNTPVDRTTAAVNHNSNSTVPSWGSVFAEQFAENIDPRVFGFAQAAFGIFEMSVGIGTSWTGVGLLVTANGADDAWAGIATMYYGEHVRTLKYRALYAATGSETVATIGEIGAGLASGAAVSRLNHLAKLAKQAQQASNVGEAVVRTADNAVETLANSVDNFAVSAASQSPVKRFELPTIQSWCFAPDTLVDTPQGKRRIDEIRENDLVFAFDFTSGQWVERPVEVCHRNLYQGSLIEISTKHGTVVATAYHPFWVLEGHDLANRPRPRKLTDTEDEGLALRGRWVNSHDLMAGDLIYSTEGRELRVLKIVQTYAEQFEVCNLTIAQNHSFAVGNAGVLVHNTGGCPKVDVGGLGYPGSMPGAPIRTASNSFEDIAAFRQRAGLQPFSEASGDTVARVVVNGRAYHGVNSTITEASRAASKPLRQRFFEMIDWVPPKARQPEHLGHAQSLTHAEAHALMRAFERQGSLPKQLTMYVDRTTCNMCRGELPVLLKRRGVERLDVYSGGSANPITILATP